VLLHSLEGVHKLLCVEWLCPAPDALQPVAA
jgi:hypothetical protein